MPRATESAAIVATPAPLIVMSPVIVVAVITPVVVVPKSICPAVALASLLSAIAAEALMSASTITPDAIDVTPAFVIATSPVTAVPVTTPVAFPSST